MMFSGISGLSTLDAKSPDIVKCLQGNKYHLSRNAAPEGVRVVGLEKHPTETGADVDSAVTCVTKALWVLSCEGRDVHVLRCDL